MSDAGISAPAAVPRMRAYPRSFRPGESGTMKRSRLAPCPSLSRRMRESDEAFGVCALPARSRRRPAQCCPQSRRPWAVALSEGVAIAAGVGASAAHEVRAARRRGLALSESGRAARERCDRRGGCVCRKCSDRCRAKARLFACRRGFALAAGVRLPRGCDCPRRCVCRGCSSAAVSLERKGFALFHNISQPRHKTVTKLI